MQYIEFVLKNIIKKKGIQPRRTHDLMKIWNVANNYLDICNNDKEILEKMISTLFNEYPALIYFRYETNLRGIECINNDFRIDLYVVKIWINVFEHILYHTYGE